MEFAMGNSWWARQDSNLGPMDYESTALTTELRARGAVEHSIALVGTACQRLAVIFMLVASLEEFL
jgi:hypothetical protein